MCEEGYVEALIDWIWLAADRETREVLSLKGLAGKALFTPVIAEVKWLSRSFEWRHRRWLGYKTLAKER